MTQPFISVIMGMYNCAGSLPSAVSSILGQTCTNLELILCDDASTDDTFRVAQALASTDKRVLVIRNKTNRHLAYSLNQCLKAAKGTYIARMDADDISLPERLEKQASFLSLHPGIALVGSAIIPYDENGERKPRVPKEFPQARDLIHGVPFYHPTIMIRKHVLEALEGYLVSKRTEKGQDLELWFRFYANGYQGYNLPEPLLKYHEAIYDYHHKRKLRYAASLTKTCLIGFGQNHFPAYLYPYALKPLLGALIPQKLMFIYHNGGKAN